MPTILTRRKFIQRLGYMMAGGLIVPYVPKVFYSFSKEIEPPYIITPDGPGKGRWILFNKPLTAQEIKIKYGISWVESFGLERNRLFDGLINNPTVSTVTRLDGNCAITL